MYFSKFSSVIMPAALGVIVRGSIGETGVLEELTSYLENLEDTLEGLDIVEGIRKNDLYEKKVENDLNLIDEVLIVPEEDVEGSSEPDKNAYFIGCYAYEHEKEHYGGKELIYYTRMKQRNYCYTRCSGKDFVGVSVPDQGEFSCSCYGGRDYPKHSRYVDSVYCSYLEKGEGYRDVYAQYNFDEVCGTKIEGIRNMLVSESNMPYGFDPTSGKTFFDTPFELRKVQCSTNMYNVYSEFGDTNSAFTTSIKTVDEFQEEKQSAVAKSLLVSKELSEDKEFLSAYASTSLSGSDEINDVLRSSGSSEAESMYTEVKQVSTVARIKLKDFETTYRFVTLTKQFVNALSNWKETGYDERDGIESILNVYGSFIMTSGMYGGYIESIATVKRTDYNKMAGSDSEKKKCIEWASKNEFEDTGDTVAQSGSESQSGSECKGDSESIYRESREAFKASAEERSSRGGTDGPNGFVSTAEYAVPLINKYDMKQFGGLKFQILSDFLLVEKIHPLEIQKHSTEYEEFQEYQQELQKLIKNNGIRIAKELKGAGCGPGEIPYRDYNERKEEYNVKCYAPNQSLIKEHTRFDARTPNSEVTFISEKKKNDIIRQYLNGERTFKINGDIAFTYNDIMYNKSRTNSLSTIEYIDLRDGKWKMWKSNSNTGERLAIQWKQRDDRMEVRCGTTDRSLRSCSPLPSFLGSDGTINYPALILVKLHFNHYLDEPVGATNAYTFVGNSYSVTG